MALTFADALVYVRGDSSRLRGDLSKAERSTQSWAKVFSANLAANLGAGLVRAISQSIRTVTTTIVSLTRELVTGNAQFETYNTRFEVLLRSATLARERMQELEEFGRTTPFELPGVVAADVILQSFGLHALDAAERYGRSGQEIRRIAGDTASGVGASMEEMAGYIGRFSAGATGEAIMRFQELGVTTRREMEAMGLEFSKAGELLTPVDEAMTVLLDILDQKFGGMMDKQSSTFEGMLSNIQDWIGSAKRYLGEPIFAFLKQEMASLLQLLESPRAAQALTILRNLFAAAFGGIAAVVKAGLQIASQVFTGWQRGTGRDMDTMAANSFEWGKNIVVQLARGMAAAIGALLSVIEFISGIIASWFAPGSPPRIAKNIDKWGTAMINEWLGGMMGADWRIFDTMSGMVERFIRSTMRGAPDGGAIEQILGSREAIREAIQAVADAGRVTDEIFGNLQQQLGGGMSPVMLDYLRNQLELQVATRDLAEAQRELNELNREYDAILEPLNDRLRQIRDAQADLRDTQRSARLREIIADSRTTDSERQAAMLELEQIQIQRQIRATEAERDAAVDSAEEKERIAQERQRQLEDEIAAQEGLLRFQEQNNTLLAELANLASGAAGAIGGLGGALGDLAGLGGLAGFDTSAIDELLPDPGEIGSMVQDIIDEVMPLFDGFDERAQRIGENFAQITDGLEREAPGWITKVETVSRSWEGNFDQMDMIRQTLHDNWVNMWPNMQIVWGIFTTNIASDWELMKGNAAELWADISTKWNSGLNTVEARTKKWQVALNAKLKDIKADFKTWFSDRLADFGTWITDIQTKFSEADWVQIGRDILDGIKDGLVAAAIDIAATAAGIVGTIINAAKAAAGIQSPSKVARDEIGKPIAQGIGEGILDGLRGVRPDVAMATRGLLANMAQEGARVDRTGFQDLAGAIIDLARSGRLGGGSGGDSYQNVAVYTTEDTGTALGRVRDEHRRRRIGLA